MTEDSQEDIPFRSPVSEAKDAFMVLIGVDRDGDVEMGKKLASKIKTKLKKCDTSIEDLIKRYSSDEPGQNDLGDLDPEEVNKLKEKYDLP